MNADWNIELLGQSEIGLEARVVGCDAEVLRTELAEHANSSGLHLCSEPAEVGEGIGAVGKALHARVWHASGLAREHEAGNQPVARVRQHRQLVERSDVHRV